MDIEVALKLTAYAMGFGLLAVVLDAVAKRVMGAKTARLSVVLPQTVLIIAVGLVLFAVAVRFDPHPWLLFGIPVAAMAGVHRLLRRRTRPRVAQSAGSGSEPAATAQPLAADQAAPAGQPTETRAGAAAERPSTAQAIVSIAIAFAVAFAVRHFVVEAFSVPMSALAPTIHGRHFEVVCDRCGGRFTEMDLEAQPPAALPCPGCGARPVRIDGGAKTQDRVLVEKLSEPARWDLAMFRQVDPDPELPKNTLTRIVGLPGESVEIAIGDVFINGRRLVKPADRIEQLWFAVADTAWGSPGKPLHGWVNEIDEAGPLLRYAHPIGAPLLTGMDESKPWLKAAHRPVRDVRLVAELAPQTRQVELSWSSGSLRCAVKADRGNPAIQLSVGQETRSIGSAAATSSLGLAVRDGVVSALADGRVIATHPLESQSSADHVDSAKLGGAPCALVVRADAAPTRIRVWRDAHYFAEDGGAEPVVRARLGDPFKLADNGYFVLADDSGLGGDSRTFTSVAPEYQAYCQPGSLSREMFIGVARWVYWPIQRARGTSVRR